MLSLNTLSKLSGVISFSDSPSPLLRINESNSSSYITDSLISLLHSNKYVNFSILSDLSFSFAVIWCGTALVKYCCSNGDNLVYDNEL